LWLSHKTEHSPDIVTGAAESHVEQPQTPATPAGAGLSKAETPNASETVSIGIPAHPGIYSYRGIELGESRARVKAKLKAIGYRTLDCEYNDWEVCSTKDTPDPGVSNMSVSFMHDRLLILAFDFNPSELFDKYVDAVTGTYGPPSRPPHPNSNIMRGMVADWQDALVEPCRVIRVITTKDFSNHNNSALIGSFSLTLIDPSSSEGAPINVDKCAVLTKDE